MVPKKAGFEMWGEPNISKVRGEKHVESSVKLVNPIAFMVAFPGTTKLMRESDMRKEIMQLQKEHLKTLIEENRQLVNENKILVSHAAQVQSEHSSTVLENVKLRARAGKTNNMGNNITDIFLDGNRCDAVQLVISLLLLTPPPSLIQRALH